MSVLILGSSHIRCLEMFLCQKNGSNTFMLDPQPEIRFVGISGGKVTNKHHVRRWERCISQYRPKYLIVQMGGNDLDSLTMTGETAETIILRLVALCKLFQVRYNITKVVVLQLLPRPRPRYLSAADYHAFLQSANKLLKGELGELSSVMYWKIRGVKNPTVNNFRDGVHLNDIGMSKYYRNIRGALIQVLKS